MSVTFKVDDVQKATKPIQSCSVLKAFAVMTNDKTNIPEAYSGRDDQIIATDYNGFASTVQDSYDRHCPLILSPDDVWITIEQGLANHINENAEALRKQFVAHEGKEHIEIIRDEFIKGNPDNDWEGCFNEFSDELSKFIGKKRDLIVSNFSTTTPASKAISEVVLMDAMKSYFTYGVSTCCGIPEITLEGTVEDWKDIRTRVNALSEFGLSWWTDLLGEIIDQFVRAANGNEDRSFWQNLYKVGGGSGGPFISGAIINLFPYLNSYKNQLVKNDYIGSRYSHLKTSNFPSSLSKVPFEWHYYQTTCKMEFVGGIIGSEQKEDLSLKPKMIWAIRDDKSR